MYGAVPQITIPFHAFIPQVTESMVDVPPASCLPLKIDQPGAGLRVGEGAATAIHCDGGDDDDDGGDGDDRW
jgi:hypothetical protein